MGIAVVATKELGPLKCEIRYSAEKEYRLYVGKANIASLNEYYLPKYAGSFGAAGLGVTLCLLVSIIAKKGLDAISGHYSRNRDDKNVK